MPIALECRDIRHTYRGDHDVTALSGASLVAQAGEVTAIVGPSGSGKSTLLHAAGLLLRATEGEVVVDGVRATELDERARAALRGRKIGYLFQQPRLVPHLTVLENAVLPLLADRNRATVQRAEQLLARVGLAGLEGRLPGTLSGGQAHRAAMCRALARSPRLVLADEPTASLDSESADGIRALLRSIAQSDSVAVVVATHDPRTIEWADEVVTLHDGSTGEALTTTLAGPMEEKA